jgi:hypothetical protein
MRNLKFNNVMPGTEHYEEAEAQSRVVRKAVNKTVSAERQRIYEASEESNENYATTVALAGLQLSLTDGIKALAKDLGIELSAEEIVAFHKKIEAIVHDTQRMLYHRAMGSI